MCTFWQCGNGNFVVRGLEKKNKPIAETQFCDAKNTEIGDNYFSIVQEYVFALQIFVHYTLGM